VEFALEASNRELVKLGSHHTRDDAGEGIWKRTRCQPLAPCGRSTASDLPRGYIHLNEEKEISTNVGEIQGSYLHAPEVRHVRLGAEEDSNVSQHARSD
jgi:hypothetical protein